MATLITDKGAPYIEDIWSLDDFRNVADGYEEEEFTEDDLLNAMELVVDNFDANLGITWETIEAALDVVAWNKKQEMNDE
tara:strand:+ start:144 stop:383 length:240 start_codon:yes stop_codon:yes gene_type:complete